MPKKTKTPEKLHSTLNDSTTQCHRRNYAPCCTFYASEIELEQGVNGLVPKGIYRFIHKHFAKTLVIIDAIVKNARRLFHSPCVSSSRSSSLIPVHSFSSGLKIKHQRQTMIEHLKILTHKTKLSK